MIFFLTTRKHSYTIKRCLRSGGAALIDSVRPMCYGKLFLAKSIQAGTYILSDLERLSPSDLERLESIHDALHNDDRIRFLNHPRNSLRRYDLLRTLFDRGINHFQVFRLEHDPRPRHFPVFIRGEDDHKGSLSPLIESQDELNRVSKLWAAKWGGKRRKLVTEYCHVGDRNGVYRKYAAFKIGDRIIPRHLFFGTDWCVKRWELLHEDLLEEEREYIRSHAHANQLAEIFRIAGIDFGRIDYGIAGDKIQVWEINTNPLLPVDYGGGGELRQALHDDFATKFVDAMRAVELPTPNRSVLHLYARTIPLWAAGGIPGRAFVRRATRGTRRMVG